MIAVKVKKVLYRNISNLRRVIIMKKYILASTPFILGLLSFLIFMIKGSSVASDGTLEEPFFLIPIGFLLLFIGVVCVVGLALISLIKKTQHI